MGHKATPLFLEEVLRKAESGDSDSCFEMGEYCYGRGEYSRACDWYQRAADCEDPNPNALFNLGYAFQYGEGRELDLFAAFEYYKKAADLDMPQAMSSLAYFYESGLVVERDLEKADALSRQATAVLSRLQLELRKLRLRLTGLTDRCETAERRSAESEQGRKAAEAERDRTRTQRDEAKSALQEANARCKGLNEEKETLTRGLAEKERSLRAERDRWEALRKKNEQALASLRTEQEKNEALTAQYDRKADECAAQQRKLQSLREELEGESQKVTSLIGQYSKSQKELTESRQTCTRQSEELEKQGEQIAALETDIKALQARKPVLYKRSLLIWCNIFLLLLSMNQIRVEYIMVEDLMNFPPDPLFFVIFGLAMFLSVTRRYKWNALLHGLYLAGHLVLFFAGDLNWPGIPFGCMQAEVTVWLLLVLICVGSLRPEKME